MFRKIPGLEESHRVFLDPADFQIESTLHAVSESNSAIQI
jgi:hypothetical protein